MAVATVGATGQLGDPLLISGGTLDPKSLAGQVAIVTGAGGGIGLEAARALLWLGASVVIAEIDRASCEAARAALAAASPGRFDVILSDVASEHSVEALVQEVEQRFGRIDIVINNATFSPAGAAVTDMPIELWDRSYAVNLRGPVLLARACLPGMIARKHGVIVCVSSTGGPFLAAYETLKAAQLAFANSLDAELADSGVIAFTIGPGLVPTKTACAAIELLAPRLGMTVDEFWKMNRGAVVSVEAAGAGFAAAVARAERYAGQEISSTQALIDAGIDLPGDEPADSAPSQGRDTAAALIACRAVSQTLAQQSKEWQERSFFERQWMLRDFKQRVGMPLERCFELLGSIQRRLETGRGVVAEDRALLSKLAGFYRHLGDLARGYVKDPTAREAQAQVVAEWVAEVDALLAGLDQGADLEGRLSR